MATKKQNRRHVVRRSRRIFNRILDDVKFIRDGILNVRYGGGLRFRDVRLKRERDDDIPNDPS